MVSKNSKKRHNQKTRKNEKLIFLSAFTKIQDMVKKYHAKKIDPIENIPSVFTEKKYLQKTNYIHMFLTNLEIR
ncbi:hypothetical protein IW16_03565 [Chryseobacterium vrystaatense]|uniref:Uncharacterized protein n=1 Tax=Chryseobacterium vrystaatense TaxID=307480 RepID=A0ABR4USY4_9FLAO|nr:hypothetical protein IW16_03565 [Chryseobacterium vrystaatense]